MILQEYTSAFSAEWLKTRRSASTWLVIIGGFFIPLITLIIAFNQLPGLAGFYKSPKFWETSFNNEWQSMAVFLLPMGVILCTSLITQLEFRNNTWKLVHTLPQRFAVVFFAKLSVIIVMMFQFFLLFNIGIVVSALIPALVLSDVSMPTESFPWLFYIKNNALFFVDCLPIIAMQYLISLRFKNFMVPIGFGLAMVIATIFCIQWEHGYWIPYTYSAFNFMQMEKGSTLPTKIDIHVLAFCWFALLTALSFISYRTRREIG